MNNLSSNELSLFPCSMGLAEIHENEAPICMVDFGRTNPSLKNILEKNEHFYIDCQRKKGVFNYYVVGDYISSVSGKINFFLSFEADNGSHERFQVAMANSMLWQLIIRTSIDTNIIIEKSSGEIKKIYESARE